MNKTIVFIAILILSLSQRIYSQTYHSGDSLLLLSIQSTYGIGWDTVPNPGNWTGVSWNNETPKRVEGLNLSSRYLIDTLDVTGLTSLKSLICGANYGLTGLDVSGLTELTFLTCAVTNISSLDLTDNTNLETVNCNFSVLQSLEVTGLTKLKELRCETNQLTSLDLTGLDSLRHLECERNQLSTLNVSGLNKLETFWCFNNYLTELDLTGLENLKILYCSANWITSLDVTQLNNLVDFDCKMNQISELEISNHPNLEFFDCTQNELTKLELTALPALREAYCASNFLDTLILGELNNLVSLGFSGNRLKEVDIAGLTTLEYLTCESNELTTFDVSSLVNLKELDNAFNYLPFSTLATGLFVNYYYYGSQGRIFEEQTSTSDITLDYSSEASVDGTLTEFNFYKDDVIVETNNTGIFETTGNGRYYCVMTNEKLPLVDLMTNDVIITITGVDEINLPDIYAFPNPASNAIYFNMPELITNISLYTINGEEVLSSDKAIGALDITGIIPGLYYLTIATNSGNLVQKIAIE